jgi:DnaK suppressor protein
MTELAAVTQARLLKRRTALQLSLQTGTASQCAALAQELSETEAALARIEQGSFGRCDSCGGAIGRQRLLAFPAARFCMECNAKVQLPR